MLSLETRQRIEHGWVHYLPPNFVLLIAFAFRRYHLSLSVSADVALLLTIMLIAVAWLIDVPRKRSWQTVAVGFTVFWACCMWAMHI